MASLCREFGISRKTGYKIVDRYEECELEGLTDRARLPAQVEAAIVAAKREKTNFPLLKSGLSRLVTQPKRKSVNMKRAYKHANGR